MSRRVRFRAGKRLWEKSDDSFIRRVYPWIPTTEVALALGRTLAATYGRARFLGVEKSAAYLNGPDACRLRRGDNIGAAFRFTKGHVPANKGLRRPGWAPGRMRETQFRKGMRNGVSARRWMPVDSTRLCDGYVYRKTADTPGVPWTRNWKLDHFLVWEAAHGRVPKGHALAFRNGNRADVRLENLELITRRQLMQRNSVHNYPKPIAQAVQLLGALNRQIRKRTAMPNNKIDDLRNHLFATLEALADKEDPMDLARAKAIADVGRVIVESAKIEVDFLKATGALKSTDFLPSEEDGIAIQRRNGRRLAQ